MGIQSNKLEEYAAAPLPGTVNPELGIGWVSTPMESGMVACPFHLRCGIERTAGGVYHAQPRWIPASSTHAKRIANVSHGQHPGATLPRSHAQLVGALGHGIPKSLLREIQHSAALPYHSHKTNRDQAQSRWNKQVGARFSEGRTTEPQLH